MHTFAFCGSGKIDLKATDLHHILKEIDSRVLPCSKLLCGPYSRITQDNLNLVIILVS